MHRGWQWIASLVLMALVAGTAAAAPVAATIDANRTGPPITKLVFGGFMEPATTRVWAEMLSDRKFFNRVTSQADPAAPAGGFGRRGPQRRWLPVGPDEFVVMDEASAFVGEWSPSVRLERSDAARDQPVRPRAARRPRLHGARGAGRQPGREGERHPGLGPQSRRPPDDPGPGAHRPLRESPAEVHTEGRHDRRPVRDRRDRHGQLPRRCRVPDAGRQRLGLQGRDPPLPEGARDRDRALAGRELRFRLRLARRARRPRPASAAARARLERHGVERHGGRRLHDLLSAHRRHTVPRRQLRPRRRPLGGRGSGVRQRPRHQPSRSAARGERPPGSLRGEDLGRRQRDVRALAVGPHAHHAVRGEAQPDGRGDAARSTRPSR